MAKNLIKGCMMGLFVGDSAGSTLEFYKGIITNDVVKNAMHSPGGGSLNVAPGQVTDDSELAMSLFKALHHSIDTNIFPIEKIAEYYIKWYNSNPFDIGMTCGRAFGFAKSADDLIANAKKYNMGSEANGSLMRIAPLAIWARKLSTSKIVSFARQEASLSHPNRICQDVNAVYCVTLVWLLNNPGDYKGAIQQAQNIMEIENIDPIVQDWFSLSNDSLDNIEAKINIGHVRHAFILAFHFLRNNVGYEEAIFETLKKGGDTDTNACIVGALIGALHGYDSIPQYMTKNILSFDCKSHDPRKTLHGYKRPSRYCVATTMYKINILID